MSELFANGLALLHPAMLALLPLAFLPLLRTGATPQDYPSLDAAGSDWVSTFVAWLLRIAGALAIAGLVLGIGGLHVKGQTITKTGEGAHIVLLIDRSSSMDNNFAGQAPEGGDESKSAAARRLIKNFILAREHDLVGIAAFSTSPMHVLPLTGHKDALLAAVDAMDRPGLAFTNVGRGLALSLDIHERDTSAAARAILLVSDGAAVIDRKVQEKLRAEFTKRKINLYWLFLRTAGTRGISDIPGKGEPDTPQAFPERHLDIFFKSLGTNYKAFEAESPQAVGEAITEISKLERNPITYVESTPRRDLTRYAYLVALLGIGLLAAAKAVEVRLPREIQIA